MDLFRNCRISCEIGAKSRLHDWSNKVYPNRFYSYNQLLCLVESRILGAERGTDASSWWGRLFYLV